MRQTKTLNVPPTPEIHAFAVASVSSGRFQNASKVVGAALRLLEEDERRDKAEDERANGR